MSGAYEVLDRYAITEFDPARSLDAWIDAKRREYRGMPRISVNRWTRSVRALGAEIKVVGACVRRRRIQFSFRTQSYAHDNARALADIGQAIDELRQHGAREVSQRVDWYGSHNEFGEAMHVTIITGYFEPTTGGLLQEIKGRTGWELRTGE